MAETFSFLNDPGARRVIHVLGKDSTRFVGGCVRNALLGLPPKDLDLATSHTPDEAITRLEAAGIRTVPTGLAHGTITAIINDEPYEITTLRIDKETDGRHAEVAFTTDWQLDAARRDFTVNAMSVSLDGELYDYFDGVKDAARGTIRFIGNPAERIEEDALRILRFFRQHAQYGSGELDADGLNACAQNRHLLDNLSAERVRDEMTRLLMSSNPVPVLAAMQAHGISPITFDLQGLEKVITSETTPDFHARFMMAEADKTELAQRWKLTNTERDRLTLLQDHQNASLEKPLLRQLGADAFTTLAHVQHAQGNINEGELQRATSLAQSWEIPTFPVSGKDLIAAGHTPGPHFSPLLRELESAWERANYKPSKEALLWAQTTLDGNDTLPGLRDDTPAGPPFTPKEKQALHFAAQAHASIGQKRKYTGQPYIEHPVAVARILKAHGYSGDVVCAALLHDVVEDTPVSIEEIHRRFGPEIGTLVAAVTDISDEVKAHIQTHGFSEKSLQVVRERWGEGVAALAEQETEANKAKNTINRKTRKAMDAEHLTHAPALAKTLKLADLLNNGENIALYDPSFAKGHYVPEMQNLYPRLEEGGDPRLFTQLTGLMEQLDTQLSDPQQFEQLKDRAAALTSLITTRQEQQEDQDLSVSWVSRYQTETSSAHAGRG